MSQFYPPLNTPQGKKIFALTAATGIVAYYALFGGKRDVQASEEKHKPLTSTNYVTTDALSSVPRPAKNANVKGSMPSAHTHYG
ncbi:hypothetical protein HYPSUDRAFT_48573 [Hypholoma sublateritium FD-334 SS-4]|uniref:Uncharacterized protein n=1 Tax=Hypholoma sublateritium (strain FD-334 SS-4) TaxID=945553 RepID=A0A0D2P451_HYPSF|nr:hypothetical protein HYPSUDRAFT_48573 [Hypholoma sublateritium FD-334 SS-4]